MVDDAFSGYDLTELSGYRRFLLAHALALPAAEAALAPRLELPRWRERASLLAADLAELNETMPVPLPFDLPPAVGAAWGALYVTEGSRLGGIVLARRVPSSYPARYLGARHESDEWRALLGAIDTTSDAGSSEWIDGAIAGAVACFTLYQKAAQSGPPST